MPATTRKSTLRRKAGSTGAAGSATVVNVHAAKTHLSRLLARVERGERITIARAGQPVAVIGPSAQSERPPLSLDDPLLNLDKFAVDGPGGTLTNEEIDRILYGGT